MIGIKIAQYFQMKPKMFATVYFTLKVTCSETPKS